MWYVIVFLIGLWFVGLLSDIGGGLIHLLLVVALIVFIYNLASKRNLQ